MDTVAPNPTDDELNLLREWRDPSGRARMGRSAVLSLVAHAAAFIFILVMPETFMQPVHRNTQEHIVTPLIDPPLVLTQREPNPEKTIREVRSPDLTPRVKAPSAPTPDPVAAAPRKPVAPPPPPRQTPQTPLPEPPKVEIAVSENPKLTLPVQPPQPLPQKPPAAFEDVAPPARIPPDQRILELPGPSVAGAIRGNLHGPGANQNGTGQVPSAGAELPQLLGDDQGVDFRPYLARVLAAVRQSWFTIMPASVKAGLRGDVSVQFAIRRDGTVRTIAFVQQTGIASLDNATVAAISGGAPFGPLPGAYRGNEIHVQMNFAYNTPKR